MGGQLAKFRPLDVVRSLVRLWELRLMYLEWADLHAKNARNHRDHARACEAFAGELANQELALEAAFNRGMVAHSQRVHDFYRQLEAKYRRLALRPWKAVLTDPDPPDLPDPFILRL